MCSALRILLPLPRENSLSERTGCFRLSEIELDSNPHMISIASRSAEGAEGSNPSPAAKGKQFTHSGELLFCAFY